MDENPSRKICVYKSAGLGVTVEVSSLPEGDVLFRHAAVEWAEVYHWMAKEGFSRDLLAVDGEARKYLGPE